MQSIDWSDSRVRVAETEHLNDWLPNARVKQKQMDRRTEVQYALATAAEPKGLRRLPEFCKLGVRVRAMQKLTNKKEKCQND